jgi:transposase
MYGKFNLYVVMKLTIEQAKEIKNLLTKGYSCSRIARNFPVSSSTIRSIKNGKRYNV